MSMGMGLTNLLPLLLAIGFMETMHLIQRRQSVRKLVSEWPIYLRWPAYLTIIMMIMNLGVPYEIPFIYFQF